MQTIEQEQNLKQEVYSSVHEGEMKKSGQSCISPQIGDTSRPHTGEV